MKTSEELVRLALGDDLDALETAVRALGSSNSDREVYCWLCVAADFGHEGADDAISDLLEHSSLRYDDCGFEQAAAHWELALAYLVGLDGMPCNLEHAATHLDHAFRFEPGREILEEINGGTGERYSANLALARLERDDARGILQSALDGNPLRRVHHLLERIERLNEVNAPSLIVESEKALIRKALASVPKESCFDEAMQHRLDAILAKPADPKERSDD